MATVQIDRDALRSYRGGSRFYTWRGDETFYSVTSLIDKGLPKPALPRWAAREVATIAAQGLDYLTAMHERDGEQGVIDYLKGAPWRKSNRAADRGTTVHEFLEELANGNVERATELAKDMDDVESSKAQQAAAFLADVDFEVTHVEAVLFSRTHQYAGTADLLGVMHDERVLPSLGFSEPVGMVLDLKTGKGIYESTAMQLAAYARADFIASGDGEELPMPDIQAGAAIHAKQRGWSLVPCDIGDGTFEAFLHTGKVATWADEVGRKAVGRAIARGGS